MWYKSDQRDGTRVDVLCPAAVAKYQKLWVGSIKKPICDKTTGCLQNQCFGLRHLSQMPISSIPTTAALRESHSRSFASISLMA